jgi:aspartate 1-decarboxylase
VIIISYGWFDEAEVNRLEPEIVMVDKNNEIIEE